MNYSLLRYPGGKTRAVKKLQEFIPENTKEICSPFFGGGSFEISLALKGVKVHGYDSFHPLVCFWKSLLENPKELERNVRLLFPLSKEDFYSLQKEIHAADYSEIEKGAVFYVLNRCSFSGTGLSGGMSPNHPRFTLSQIDRISKFDAEFSVEEKCFSESIKLHDCLVYADPPYLINQSLYGTNGSTHKGFNHKLLSEILNNRGNFILSYNNCEEVKDLYSKHNFFYPQWKYGMSNNKESKEILIISKE